MVFLSQVNSNDKNISNHPCLLKRKLIIITIIYLYLIITLITILILIDHAGLDPFTILMDDECISHNLTLTFPCIISHIKQQWLIGLPRSTYITTVKFHSASFPITRDYSNISGHDSIPDNAKLHIRNNCNAKMSSWLFESLEKLDKSYILMIEMNIFQLWKCFENLVVISRSSSSKHEVYI